MALKTSSFEGVDSVAYPSVEKAFLLFIQGSARERWNFVVMKDEGNDTINSIIEYRSAPSTHHSDVSGALRFV